MDGECMNCGEVGNWCKCDEPQEPDINQAALYATLYAAVYQEPKVESNPLDDIPLFEEKPSKRLTKASRRKK